MVSLAALLVIGATVAAIVVAVVPSLTGIVGAFDAGIGAVRAQLAGLGVPSEVAAILQRIAEAIRGSSLPLADVVNAAADIVTIAILGRFPDVLPADGRGQGLGLGAGRDRRLATTGVDDWRSARSTRSAATSGEPLCWPRRQLCWRPF